MRIALYLFATVTIKLIQINLPFSFSLFRHHDSQNIPESFIKNARDGNAFVGRIFLVCLVLACKYSKEPEDCVVNRCWADVSGLELHQVNALERDVMRALDYSLHVSEKEWCKWQVFIMHINSTNHSLPVNKILYDSLLKFVSFFWFVSTDMMYDI